MTFTLKWDDPLFDVFMNLLKAMSTDDRIKTRWKDIFKLFFDESAKNMRLAISGKGFYLPDVLASSIEELGKQGNVLKLLPAELRLLKVGDIFIDSTAVGKRIIGQMEELLLKEEKEAPAKELQRDIEYEESLASELEEELAAPAKKKEAAETDVAKRKSNIIDMKKKLAALETQ